MRAIWVDVFSREKVRKIVLFQEFLCLCLCIYARSPHLRDVRIQAGYNYSETQSNLAEFTSDTDGFSITFAHAFYY